VTDHQLTDSRPAGRLGPHPRDAGREELWGYAIWSLVAITISIPETIAGLWDKAPWPTLSDTVGELEWLWSPTAIVVVAFMVFVLAHAGRGLLWAGSAVPPRRARGRTQGGRFTLAPARAGRARNVVSPFLYFPAALAVVTGGSVIAAVYGSDRFVLGYVLYALLGTFCIAIPALLALWHAWDVPFPTLFATVANLERRFHFLAIAVVAALVVLALHLAFFPWPDIAHILQRQPP
jgi:hypothetical protein